MIYVHKAVRHRIAVKAKSSLYYELNRDVRHMALEAFADDPYFRHEESFKNLLYHQLWRILKQQWHELSHPISAPRCPSKIGYDNVPPNEWPYVGRNQPISLFLPSFGLPHVHPPTIASQPYNKALNYIINQLMPRGRLSGLARAVNDALNVKTCFITKIGLNQVHARLLKDRVKYVLVAKLQEAPVRFDLNPASSSYRYQVPDDFLTSNPHSSLAYWDKTHGWYEIHLPSGL
jgi:hypothetical protein